MSAIDEIRQQLRQMTNVELSKLVSSYEYEMGKLDGGMLAYNLLLDYAADAFKYGDDVMASRFRLKANSVRVYVQQSNDAYILTTFAKERRDIALEILLERDNE